MPSLWMGAGGLSVGGGFAPTVGLSAGGGLSPAGGPVTEPDGYDVIVLIGQSNMVGRGGPIDPVLDATNPRIFQYELTNQIVSLAADPLQNWDGTANTIGPGLTIAKQHLATMAPNRNILLVPAADGGTGFVGGTPSAAWGVGGICRTTAIARANAAMAQGTGVNRLIAFCWNQGESDAGQTEATYAGLLDAFIYELRSSVTGATVSTPFIVGELPIGGAQTTAPIQAALADTPARTAYTAWVTSSGLTIFDTLHYNAASTRTLGQRYFNAFASARANAVAPSISGTPAAASQNVSYTFTPTLRGGVRPVTFSITAGSLPVGLSLNPSTGVISGTPTVAGPSSFTITATDALNQTGTLPTSITVAAGMIDEFTDPDGTNLTAHVANTGETWTVGGGAWVINSNETYASTFSNTFAARSSFTGGNVAVTGELVFSTLLGTQSAYLFLRSVDGTNGYLAGYNRTAQVWRIVRLINGTTGNIGSSTAVTINPGQVYNLEFRANGSTLTLFVDNTQVATATDTNHTTGNVGMAMFAASSTTTTGARFRRMTAAPL